MSKLTLYAYMLCPFCQRVRLALEALKVDYDYVEIDILAGEQRSEAYKQINPFSKVPSIAYEGKVVFESLVLLEFVNDLYGGVFSSADVDVIGNAQQRIWGAYFDQNVATKFYPIFANLKPKNEAAIEKAARDFIEAAKYFTENSGLSSTIQANPKALFSGSNDKLSYVDFVAGPHIQIFDSMIRLALNKSLFEFVDSPDDITIARFKLWATNIANTEAYHAITDKLKSIPVEKNTLLQENGIDSLEKFNYAEFYKLYFNKRFA